MSPVVFQTYCKPALSRKFTLSLTRPNGSADASQEGYRRRGDPSDGVENGRGTGAGSVYVFRVVTSDGSVGGKNTRYSHVYRRKRVWHAAGIAPYVFAYAKFMEIRP